MTQETSQGEPGLGPPGLKEPDNAWAPCIPSPTEDGRPDLMCFDPWPRKRMYLTSIHSSTRSTPGDPVTTPGKANTTTGEALSFLIGPEVSRQN